jgi:hypothetical protein
MNNKLIVAFTVIFLFLLFLNSGGIYSYIDKENFPILRINKITNNIQVLDSEGWRDINKKYKN